MRSLLLLGLAFTLLVTYIETVVLPAPATTSHVAMAKVIRSNPPVAQPSLPQLAISPRPLPTLITPIILNLQVPNPTGLFTLQQLPRKSRLNLLKKSKKPEITYNAELVYDIEKGENITGGKVNINIPFG